MCRSNFAAGDTMLGRQICRLNTNWFFAEELSGQLAGDLSAFGMSLRLRLPSARTTLTLRLRLPRRLCRQERCQIRQRLPLALLLALRLFNLHLLPLLLGLLFPHVLTILTLTGVADIEGPTTESSWHH